MILLLFLITIFYHFFYLVHLLRWLSFLQQKEYRNDRFSIFLASTNGRAEWHQLIPYFNQLKWKNLKRPKLTARMLSIIFLYLLALFFVEYRYFLAPLINQSRVLDVFYWAVLISFLLLFYLGIPIFVYFFSLPSQFLYYGLTFLKLIKAKKLLSQHKPQIIGITGSYGKTTTKLLLAQILANKYSVFATPKSFNTRYSLPQAILQNYQGEEIMILEYAAYAKGEIAALAKYFPPDIVVITGFTPQHLALFGSEQAIAQAKAELIIAAKDKKQVFVNREDSNTQKILQAANSSTAHYYTPTIFTKPNLNKIAQLHFVWQGKKIQTSLVGKQYLQALALAVNLAKQFNFTNDQIIKALQNIKINDHFIQLKYNQNKALIVDDGYSSNPQGFNAALTIAKHLKKLNKKMILFTSGIVDLGSKSNEIHTNLAEKARTLFDQVFYLGAVGDKEFAKVFGKDFSIDSQRAINLLKNADDKTIFLIEGRMPPIIVKFLERQANANFS